MKQDDGNVLDDEILYRLVSPKFARRNQHNSQIIEIVSGVFHTSSLSALRLNEFHFRLAQQADQNLGRAAKPDYGVAIFSAHFIRHALGGIICIEDEPEFPPKSHVVIYRDSSGLAVTKSQYKNLANAAHLAISPQGIP